MLRIAIIGAGFSGAILAARLLEKSKALPLKVLLIDKNGKPGLGPAYSTNKEYHLLNVKAQNMSAFPETPDHFVNWLYRNNISLSASGHMPRKTYRSYIQSILEESIDRSAGNSFEFIPETAGDLEYTEKGIRIKTTTRTVEADKAVLALGNYPPSPLPGINFSNLKDRYCPDPWAFNCTDAVGKDDPVLIIGSGLTMADTCMTLAKNNHRGKVYSLSKNGFMPAVHQYPVHSYPSFFEELKEKTTILDIFKIFKIHLSKAEEQSIDWRAVIDSFRPFIQKVWTSLPVEERRKFFKYLNRRWSIARHRIPPEYNEVLQSMQRSGQLQILSGRIKQIRPEDNLHVEYLSQEKNSLNILEVKYIINCTGPEINYSKVQDPFLQNLLRKEIIQPGPLQMGLNASEDGVICNAYNCQKLFAIGPPLIGILFETTAVPELRVQAKNLAERILKECL